jgi:tetratricopeptide (TPR) repeat protein
MKRVLTVCLLLGAVMAFSQEKKPEKEIKDRNLPKGNDLFEDKDYAGAEAQYRISGSNAPTKSIASYNLGNAIYKEKKSAEAAFAYGRAIENAKTKQEKHQAFHNLGNAMMQLKAYDKAVEAYKNALRNNPADEQTRYNYALAKDLLKKNPPPPPQKNDDKDKKDNKDKDKKDKSGNDKDKNQDPNKGDNKDKDKDKDKGNNKQDNNQDKGDNKDKKNGDGKDKQDKGDPKPTGASPNRDQMQRLLDAMNNEEKKVQDKVKNGQKVRGQQVKPEKDW